MVREQIYNLLCLTGTCGFKPRTLRHHKCIVIAEL